MQCRIYLKRTDNKITRRLRKYITPMKFNIAKDTLTGELQYIEKIYNPVVSACAFKINLMIHLKFIYTH